MTIPFKYTVCFLTRGSDILMLYRNKPPNQGLWNGVGGHIEADETPLVCCLREVNEETGFILQEAYFAGLLTWEGYEIPDGGLYLFTAQAPQGDPHHTAEGKLAWKPLDWVLSDPQVVSNIHIFGPAVLNGADPQVYHFEYRQGIIQQYRFLPLPEEFDWQGVGRG